ncbi:MAG: CRISPR-associated endonuclease Cas1 [Fervidobacterium sp.]|nr:CRISPR-associated endonuclease Cas1 [Fervidobacterium sp.]
MVLYITEQGAVLSKSEGRLLVTKNGQNIAEVPLNKIERVNILGNISLTTQIINYFLDHGVDVVFMTQHGKYRGKLYTDGDWNVFLRLKQYEKSTDEAFRLKMAKSIVKGKLRNYYDFLLSRSRRMTKGALSEQLAAIRKSIEKAGSAKDIDEVRGHEGIGSRYYFQGLSKILKREDFNFEGRTAHPPKDPVNSMLSFGYHFLYNELLAAINAVGLDPYFGNLHTIDVSKKSLLFDLVEEFRCIIIDNFVLTLLNRQMIKPEHFQVIDEGIIHFTDEGLKTFISRYEEFMSKKMTYHLDGEENYIRTVFEKQARHYARVVMDEEEEYVPYYKPE